MSDFKKIQSELAEVSIKKEQAHKTLFLEKESLKKLKRQRLKVERSISDNNPITSEIFREESRINKKIEDVKKSFETHTNKEKELRKSFEKFSDPRKHLKQYSDEYPILFVPLRIETRFKKNRVNDEIKHELWVRVFPDDCSVDTYDDILTETEVKKIQQYWKTVWTCGKSDKEELQAFIQRKRKGAWKGLVNNLQPGRSYWITENYKPVNELEIPNRDFKDDVILVIETDTLLDSNLQNALKQYWTEIWLANGEETLIESAFETFQTLVNISEEDAKNSINTNRPFNFDDPKLSSEIQPKVSVAFIQFPSKAESITRTSSWSKPAKAISMPERFVLLGYKGKDNDQKPIEVLNRIGSALPNPLVIGPNPSLDVNEELKQAFIDDYINLVTEDTKTKFLIEYYNKIKIGIRAETDQEDFVNDILNLPSLDEIKETLGELFENLEDDIKASQYIDYLRQRSETKWLFDFEEAVKVGMGFKEEISSKQYHDGFDRLFVIGVKLSANELQAKAELEKLIQHHHYGMSGFSIIKQGAPTNNTEDENSGFSESETNEDSYNRYFGNDTTNESDDFFKKTDGKWLSEFLGIDQENASLKKVENYFNKDICESKAMNVALWNATIGNYMESMLTPLFSDWQIDVTREFYSKFVSGRGNLPVIRIGNQPYGILVTSALKNSNWLDDNFEASLPAFSDKKPVLKKMYTLLIAICKDWEDFFDKVAFVGKEGDPYKNLMDAISLHATSVEFHQRYAKSFAQLYNQLNLTQVCRDKLANDREALYKKDGLELLKELGYSYDEKNGPIPILEKFFLDSQNKLNSNLIDDQPLSEINAIRDYISAENPGEKGKNYIHWLVENAISNHDKIKKQEGFSDNVPKALLYQMLRHSLNLEFSNTALKLHHEVGVFNNDQVRSMKIDPDFIGVNADSNVIGRYDILDRIEPAITNENITVGNYINQLLINFTAQNHTDQLRQMIDALGHLKDMPTAKLERALVEHIDSCYYRLDAWLLGFTNLQLYSMRNQKDDNGDVSNKQGIYLGAYGWVENLKPDNEELVPIELNEELNAVFNPNNDLEIVTDSSNAGYIHAPSINQATTAAILRNAHISVADSENQAVYKINLSSERVRMALSIIEGIQQGQNLGALLGYQLERGLHDRNDLELDEYIYELRKVFSLVANRTNETSIEENNEDFEDDKAITKIEARNVIDGLKLINHIHKTNISKYPFGFEFGKGINKLKNPNNTAINKAIDDEVDRILNINDALADLATAEGVHQVVQGNFQRASSTLETYSKGKFPQNPEVIKTPRSGVTLTHRFSIHLNPNSTQVLNATPRAIAEPAINDFLIRFLPSLNDIKCLVEHRNAIYGESPPEPLVEEIISLKELGFQPIDLLYVLNIDGGENLSALDDYVVKFIYENHQLKPDAEIRIKYTEPIENMYSIFEVSALIKSLRSVILGARPLKNTDIQLANEAKTTNDSLTRLNSNRVITAFNNLKISFVDGDPNKELKLVNRITHPLIDLYENNAVEGISYVDIISDDQLKMNTLINTIDHFINSFINEMHHLSMFGLQGTGFGFIYNEKARIYSLIYKKVFNYGKRWESRLDVFNLLITQAGATVNLEEKIEILQKAERTISTSYTIPIPAVVDYIDDLAMKAADFEEKLEEINNFLDDKFINIKDLIAALDKIKTGTGTILNRGLEEFDLLSIDTKNEEKQFIVLAEDMIVQAKKLNTGLKEKTKLIENTLNQQSTEANLTVKAKLLTEIGQSLFGEDFILVPVFELTDVHLGELNNCSNPAHTKQLLKFQEEELDNEIPLDDWLYGIARVRDKMSHWENITILSEGFSKDDSLNINLTPIQLPFKPDDFWLALEYPKSYSIESDKLIYTSFDFKPIKAQCGLLVDEWTEVIPTDKETTGLTFQSDQPNAEAPQTMLLVTPSKFKGEWQWTEVVDALHETLDLTRLRAMEPAHFDDTAYAQFLPANVASVTRHPFMTMMLNYSMVNGLKLNTTENGD